MAMEMNCEVVVKQMPGAVENIENVFLKKLPALCEDIMDFAEETKWPANEKIAAEFAKAADGLQGLAKSFCGKEGDTLEVDGTARGAIHAAKQILAVTEGGMN